MSITAVVIEGSFKIQATGAPAETARLSKCQVLRSVNFVPVPNASAIQIQCDLYATKADYDSGKNPLPNSFGGAMGVGGPDLDTAFPGGIADVTPRQVGAFLLTLPQFNATE